MSEKITKKEFILSPEHLSLYRENIAKGSNFTFSDKGFVQRKALTTQEDKIMFDYSNGHSYYATVIPTETYVYVEGERAKVVILKEWDDIEDKIKILWFKLVFNDGRFKDIGSINLSGSSPKTSGKIDAFTIYSGASVKGCGIFFIIKKSYITGDVEGSVYELSKDQSQWIRLESDDMYWPTVFFNGRGESYYMALNNDPTYKLDTPQYLESKNLLTGAFKSYFTTDGYSYSFSLPFDDLTNEEVTCVYNYDREVQFIWTVKAGHSVSESVSVEGKNVKLYCDREKGRMVFRTTEGELYSLTRGKDANNIWFKAYKTDNHNILKVASMNISTQFSGKSSDCAMTVFAGSESYPSTVLWIDSNNPLYFPEVCHTEIGDIKEKITGLTAQKGHLLAFKETQVFKGNFISSEGYQIEGVLGGVKGSGSIKESKVAFDLIASLSSMPMPRTVKEIGGTVFFATVDGGVYALKGEGGKISEISPNGTFSEPSFAALDEGNYILFTGEKSYLLWDTKSLKLPIWFEQKYPAKVLDSANLSPNPVFFCTTGYEYSPIIYNLLVKGEKDGYFRFNNDNTVSFKEQRINSNLELGLIKDSFSYNRLCRLTLTGESFFGINLLVKNGETLLFARSFPNMLKKIEALCGGVFSELFLGVNFKGPFTLKGIGCLYRGLKK